MIFLGFILVINTIACMWIIRGNRRLIEASCFLDDFYSVWQDAVLAEEYKIANRYMDASNRVSHLVLHKYPYNCWSLLRLKEEIMRCVIYESNPTQ